MSKIIGDCQCPSCAKNGGDKTGDHLILFDDGGSFCNRCGYSEAKDTFTKPRVVFSDNRTEAEKKVEVAEVKGYTSYRSIPDRRLDKASLTFYGIRCTTSTIDGETITGTFFPAFRDKQLTGYNVRYTNKRFSKRGDVKKCDFFGAECVPRRGNKLFITEGAFDMVALYQALYKNSEPKWRKFISVVSLRNGVGGVATEFERNKELLKGYKEIVIVFDQDTAGKKGEEEAIKSLGRDKVKITRMSEKDANDMVMKGKWKELCSDVLSAQSPTPDTIVTIDQIFDQCFIKPEMGLSWPWSSLTKMTRGIRRAMVYIVGAAPKIGKTDFEYQTISHLALAHNVPVGLYDLESPSPIKTAKRLAGKATKHIFHDPAIEYKKEDLVEGLNIMKDYVQMYDHSGSRDWEVIQQTIRYQALQGIWIFIIDPLTALISQYSSSEANDRLNSLMTDVASLAIELDITFMLFSHLNPVHSGKAHDDGGRVLSSQFTGSRAMEKWAHYGIGIERNRNAEEPEEKNTSIHRLLFDREFGDGGSYQCRFDSDTGDYHELLQGEVNF